MRAGERDHGSARPCQAGVTGFTREDWSVDLHDLRPRHGLACDRRGFGRTADDDDDLHLAVDTLRFAVQCGQRVRERKFVLLRDNDARQCRRVTHGEPRAYGSTGTGRQSSALRETLRRAMRTARLCVVPAGSPAGSDLT